MPKPLLLDLYCKAGGCSVGYSQAGFDVIGVDIEPQPHYPFKFIQMDALEFMDTADLSEFDVIHASPVCKAYTYCNLSPTELYHKGIDDIRQRLLLSGLPFVIENVVGAKAYMNASLLLCGSMFGLRVKRHRLFEIGGTDLFIPPPARCDHSRKAISCVGRSIWDYELVGTPRKDGKSRPDSVPVQVGYDAMNIHWMNMTELAQAIPPAYTEYIGARLLESFVRV